mmetsp:Transcript_12324/g.20928  ORF Transcript_12324/g.20928 Transcript_12324/m.20928 type:complete len:226 (+) Transcript_12324:724-1401(+)
MEHPKDGRHRDGGRRPTGGATRRPHGAVGTVRQFFASSRRHQRDGAADGAQRNFPRPVGESGELGARGGRSAQPRARVRGLSAGPCLGAARVSRDARLRAGHGALPGVGRSGPQQRRIQGKEKGSGRGSLEGDGETDSRCPGARQDQFGRDPPHSRTLLATRPRVVRPLPKSDGRHAGWTENMPSRVSLLRRFDFSRNWNARRGRLWNDCRQQHCFATRTLENAR